MSKEVFIIPKKRSLERKVNVAAYARVSSGKDAMLQSLSAQVSYYSELIQNNPKWLYAGVYVDEAVTGTTDDRIKFQRMLDRAKNGEIDLIITKSISRFARNTVTILQSIRELKALGVGVYFEEENINTLSGEGELMLSILASYAQEESRSVSENQKWRIKKNFKEGKPWGAKLFAYTYKNGKLEVIDDEADIVRKIYKLYLYGVGMWSIAKRLNEKGLLTRKGKRWYHSSIKRILTNYYYTGNLILQTTYRKNHLTKRAKQNNGEYPKYHVENSHEAIVSLDEFNKVQNLIRKRSEKFDNISPQNNNKLSGIIKCAKCGASFRRKKSPYKVNYHCATFLTRGKQECASKQVPEDVLLEVYNEFEGCIEKIVVKDDNTLIIILSSGQNVIKMWEYESRSKSWTKEMREKARQKELRRRKYG